MKSRLKIGILGTRGIPNAYGGFEQFAQYLSTGLIQKGHDVWVYNSHKHPYQQSQWNGVHIIHCKDWEHRIGTAGQFIYDYNCIVDAQKRSFDILLQLGYTSNSVWYFKWPKNSINIVNMDGLEWKRSKYGKLTRRFLKFAEGLAANHGDVLIADSKGIQTYLTSEYNKQSIYIPYGADAFESVDDGILKKYNLSPKQYFLLIARMEPENNIEMVIKGYLASEKKIPLVIVGNAENKFGKFLQKKYQNNRLKFVGPIYNQYDISNIRYYSDLYFHGHSVGGTNPSLLEAMACECNIAAHDNTFNKAILTEYAYYFSSSEDISRIINHGQDESIISYRKRKNLEKIYTFYSWPQIINDYEKVFLEALQSQVVSIVKPYIK